MLSDILEIIQRSLSQGPIFHVLVVRPFSWAFGLNNSNFLTTNRFRAIRGRTTTQS